MLSKSQNVNINYGGLIPEQFVVPKHFIGHRDAIMKYDYKSNLCFVIIPNVLGLYIFL